jgi:hypothetical protein
METKKNNHLCVYPIVLFFERYLISGSPTCDTSFGFIHYSVNSTDGDKHELKFPCFQKGESRYRLRLTMHDSHATKFLNYAPVMLIDKGVVNTKLAKNLRTSVWKSRYSEKNLERRDEIVEYHDEMFY